MDKLERLRNENESMRNRLKDPSEDDIDALNALRDKYKFDTDEFGNFQGKT